SQVEAPFVIAHTGNYDNHGKYRFLYLTPAHNKTLVSSCCAAPHHVFCPEMGELGTNSADGMEFVEQVPRQH
ncbi:MAG: hypothetical protein ACFNVK_12600, partial [Prevotella sp.]